MKKLALRWTAAVVAIFPIFSFAGKDGDEERGGHLISHQLAVLEDVSTTVAQIKTRIVEAGDKAHTTVAEQLSLLEEISQFEFGRFLLSNQGINGFWTQYMVLHPRNGRITGRGRDDLPLHPRERWLLDSAPAFLATQERFSIFQQELQNRIRSGMRLASIPCGLMDDLLGLNYEGFTGISLVGIDLDEQSLVAAKQNAREHHLEGISEFHQQDAWELGSGSEFDLITSNGLNIYEPSDAKVLRLYREFYKVLRPGGVLVISFLTPPSAVNAESPWNMIAINPENARLQRVIFSDILGVKWQAFRMPELTIAQLTEAGFKNVQIIFDKARVFPTVLAEK